MRRVGAFLFLNKCYEKREGGECEESQAGGVTARSEDLG